MHIEKKHLTIILVFAKKVKYYELEFSLPRAHFSSPAVMNCLTLHLSHRLQPHPPPTPFYCCHLLFALHGFWLYPRGNFASSTEFSYKHTNYIHACTEEEEKILAFRGFAYQMCCQIMSCISCQVTVFSPRLPKRKDSSTKMAQCKSNNLPHCILLISHK